MWVTVCRVPTVMEKHGKQACRGKVMKNGQKNNIYRHTAVILLCEAFGLCS